ncbi:MAG: hypothetical protein ACRBCT_00385 [Alphaproteobacteria bacterium]
MKSVFQILFFSFMFTSVAMAGSQKAQKRGVIQNDSGQKCWYNQEFLDDEKYFFDKHTQNIGVMTFEDTDCMRSSDFGLDVNKMSINNVISKWYSHSDADFATRSHELYPTSQFQIKGKCIQSKTYGNIGILVDYSIKNDSIYKVTHGSSIQGCREK